MYVHGRIPISTVNGPGRRCVIHVQGCDLGCPGCWNPKTHPHGIGKDTSIVELAEWVLGMAQADVVEGLTISGGEPLQQASDLFWLLRTLKKVRPRLATGIFTGYTNKELEAGKFRRFEGRHARDGSGYIWSGIRDYLDFAVMGRYNQQKHTQNMPLCGSSNQTIELFSDRYKLGDFEPQSAEITISADGQHINVTGFPSSHEKLKEGLCEGQTISSLSTSPQSES